LYLDSYGTPHQDQQASVFPPSGYVSSGGYNHAGPSQLANEPTSTSIVFIEVKLSVRLRRTLNHLCNCSNDDLWMSAMINVSY